MVGSDERLTFQKALCCTFQEVPEKKYDNGFRVDSHGLSRYCSANVSRLPKERCIRIICGAGGVWAQFYLAEENLCAYSSSVLEWCDHTSHFPPHSSHLISQDVCNEYDNRDGIFSLHVDHVPFGRLRRSTDKYNDEHCTGRQLHR